MWLGSDRPMPPAPLEGCKLPEIASVWEHSDTNQNLITQPATMKRKFKKVHERSLQCQRSAAPLVTEGDRNVAEDFERSMLKSQGNESYVEIQNELNLAPKRTDLSIASQDGCKPSTTAEHAEKLGRETQNGNGQLEMLTMKDSIAPAFISQDARSLHPPLASDGIAARMMWCGDVISNGAYGKNSADSKPRVNGPVISAPNGIGPITLTSDDFGPVVSALLGNGLLVSEATDNSTATEPCQTELRLPGRFNHGPHVPVGTEAERPTRPHASCRLSPAGDGETGRTAESPMADPADAQDGHGPANSSRDERELPTVDRNSDKQTTTENTARQLSVEEDGDQLLEVTVVGCGRAAADRRENGPWPVAPARNSPRVTGAEWNVPAALAGGVTAMEDQPGPAPAGSEEAAEAGGACPLPQATPEIRSQGELVPRELAVDSCSRRSSDSALPGGCESRPVPASGCDPDTGHSAGSRPGACCLVDAEAVRQRDRGSCVIGAVPGVAAPRQGQGRPGLDGAAGPSTQLPGPTEPTHCGEQRPTAATGGDARAQTSSAEVAQEQNGTSFETVRVSGLGGGGTRVFPPDTRPNDLRLMLEELKSQLKQTMRTKYSLQEEVNILKRQAGSTLPELHANGGDSGSAEGELSSNRLSVPSQSALHQCVTLGNHRRSAGLMHPAAGREGGAETISNCAAARVAVSLPLSAAAAAGRTAAASSASPADVERDLLLRRQRRLAAAVRQRTGERDAALARAATLQETATAAAEEAAALRRRLDDVRAELAQQAADGASEVAARDARLEEARRELAAVREDWTRLAADAARKDAGLQEARAELDTLRADVDELRTEVAERNATIASVLGQLGRAQAAAAAETAQRPVPAEGPTAGGDWLPPPDVSSSKAAPASWPMPRPAVSGNDTAVAAASPAWPDWDHELWPGRTDTESPTGAEPARSSAEERLGGSPAAPAGDGWSWGENSSGSGPECGQWGQPEDAGWPDTDQPPPAAPPLGGEQPTPLESRHWPAAAADEAEEESALDPSPCRDDEADASCLQEGKEETPPLVAPRAAVAAVCRRGLLSARHRAARRSPLQGIPELEEASSEWETDSSASGAGADADVDVARLEAERRAAVERADELDQVATRLDAELTAVIIECEQWRRAAREAGAGGELRAQLAAAAAETAELRRRLDAAAAENERLRRRVGDDRPELATSAAQCGVETAADSGAGREPDRGVSGPGCESQRGVSSPRCEPDRYARSPESAVGAAEASRLAAVALAERTLSELKASAATVQRLEAQVAALQAANARPEGSCDHAQCGSKSEAIAEFCHDKEPCAQSHINPVFAQPQLGIDASSLVQVTMEGLMQPHPTNVAALQSALTGDARSAASSPSSFMDQSASPLIRWTPQANDAGSYSDRLSPSVTSDGGSSAATSSPSARRRRLRLLEPDPPEPPSLGFLSSPETPAADASEVRRHLRAAVAAAGPADRSPPSAAAAGSEAEARRRGAETASQRIARYTELEVRRVQAESERLRQEVDALRRGLLAERGWVAEAELAAALRQNEALTRRLAELEESHRGEPVQRARSAEREESQMENEVQQSRPAELETTQSGSQPSVMRLVKAEAPKCQNEEFQRRPSELQEPEAQNEVSPESNSGNEALRERVAQLEAELARAGQNEQDRGAATAAELETARAELAQSGSSCSSGWSTTSIAPAGTE